MQEHTAGQDLEFSMADCQGGKWDHFTMYLNCRKSLRYWILQLSLLFFFWLLPKTHSAFLLKASYLDNAVLVRHSNVAFHLSVKHLVVGQY